MALSREYSIERCTLSGDADPSSLQGAKYWYNTGTTENGEKVYHDNLTGLYAFWHEATLDAWIISLVGDVGGGIPDSYFLQGVGDDLIGAGSWSGTLTASDYVLADAWERAEATAFASLMAYTGGKENVDCFRGFLPVQGDDEDYKTSNVWMMSSGSSSSFDSDRLASNDALWCSLRSDARIDSIWESRTDAMRFAGLVQSWLRETNNLNETESISWVNMVDIPAEPEIYRTDGRVRHRYWLQTIDLELVYRTESVHA